MAQILGSTGVDALTGTKSDDYLNGGPGDDTLTGGKGLDAYGLSLGGAHDLVTDFFEAFNKHSGWTHETVVFDGFGNWTPAELGPFNQLWPQWLHDGEQFTTDLGHTLTVHDGGTGTVLAWDTGDSLTLQGVAPDQINASWLFSIGSYGWVFPAG